MRLASAVVAEHEQALVIDRFVEGKLRDHLPDDSSGHIVRDDVSGDQFLRFIRTIRGEKLDDRLDWLELDKIAVAHRFFPFVLPQPEEPTSRINLLCSAAISSSRPLSLTGIRLPSTRRHRGTHRTPRPQKQPHTNYKRADSAAKAACSAARRSRASWPGA